MGDPDGLQVSDCRVSPPGSALVPRHEGTGGRRYACLASTKRGDRYLRTLLIHGARCQAAPQVQGAARYGRCASPEAATAINVVTDRAGQRRLCAHDLGLAGSRPGPSSSPRGLHQPNIDASAAADSTPKERSNRTRRWLLKGCARYDKVSLANRLLDPSGLPPKLLRRIRLKGPEAHRANEALDRQIPSGPAGRKLLASKGRIQNCNLRCPSHPNPILAVPGGVFKWIKQTWAGSSWCVRARAGERGEGADRD